MNKQIITVPTIQRINTDKMKVFEVVSEDGNGPSQGWKAYCQNTPAEKMSASWLSSCKARGYKSRDTGKSQKMGNTRVSLDGKKLKSQQYGGPVSPTATG